MTISDLLNTYYFHDSLVEKVVYRNNSVDITIDFCFWMQSGYQDENPETGIIHLFLPKVTSLSGPTGDIDDFSILEAHYDDSIFSLLLMDDFNNISYELKIIMASDEVEILL